MREQNWKRWIAAVILAVLTVAMGIWPASAQGAARLAGLTVSLWPEYDRPGVLVIYRGVIADDVALPVTLQFLIPKASGGPVNTAGVDANSEFHYWTWKTADAGEFIAVSFTNPYREFQMEYYYNPLITDGTLRAFAYSYQADYPVDNLVLEVKQPAGAQNLSLTPAATSTSVDFDDLPLQKYTVGALNQGQTFQLTAAYDKTDARLSSEILGLDAPSTAEFEDKSKSTGSKDVVAYILIGAAATLLIGAGVYAFLQSRKRPKRPAKAAPAKSSKEKSRKAAQPRADTSSNAFCHQCGNRLRQDAQFCPKCGAKVKRR